MQFPAETMCSRVFSHSDLLQLVDDYEPPCLSLYMPTHAVEPDRKQDEIHLRNLMQEAEKLLVEQETPPQRVKQFLSSVERLPQDLNSWRRRSTVLAVFCAEAFFRCFCLPLRFEESVVVNDCFQISPLMPLLHTNGRFFILALTKDSADLYEATRYSMVERGLPVLQPPTFDEDQSALQFHSHQTPSGGGRSTKKALFHGQKGSADHEKADISNFFKRQVEPGVSHALRDQRAPLVLACVDEMASLYREANSYPFLNNETVPDSPAEAELHKQAWKIVAPSFREVEERARQKYEALAGSERTQTSPAPILKAARRGQVDTLFLPKELSTASSANPATIEEAAEQTLLFGGQVLAIDDVPGDSSLAAVLRY